MVKRSMEISVDQRVGLWFSDTWLTETIHLPISLGERCGASAAVPSDCTGFGRKPLKIGCLRRGWWCRV